MNTLDQWEADAEELQNIWHRNLNPTQAMCCERILRLIELVRKKDESLSCFVFDEEIPPIGKSYWLDEADLKLAKKALALTEGLNDL